MKLTKNEAQNLIDALQEWEDEIGPKELEENEIGLNAERFDDLMARLHWCAGKHHPSFTKKVLDL